MKALRIFLRFICWFQSHDWVTLVEDSKINYQKGTWDWYRNSQCQRCGKTVIMREGGWK